MYDPRMFFSREYLHRYENRTFIARVKQAIDVRLSNIWFNAPRILITALVLYVRPYVAYARHVHHALIEQFKIHLAYWPIVSYIALRVSYEYIESSVVLWSCFCTSAFAIAHFVDRLRVDYLEPKINIHDEDEVSQAQSQNRIYRTFLFLFFLALHFGFYANVITS